MKINTNKVGSSWHTIVIDDCEVSVLLRPQPYSMIKINTNDMDQVLLNQFLYCVVEWKGLVGSDDLDLKCDDDNKTFIYDYVHPLRNQIIEKLNEINKKVADEVKN